MCDVMYSVFAVKDFQLLLHHVLISVKFRVIFVVFKFSWLNIKKKSWSRFCMLNAAFTSLAASTLSVESAS